MRQVYELSGNLTEANKDQAVEVTLGSDVDQIEGPGTMNVVRVRCPSQFVGVGTGTVAIGSGTAVAVEPYSSPAEAISNYEHALRVAALSESSTAIDAAAAAAATTTFRTWAISAGDTLTWTLPDDTTYTVTTTVATTFSPVRGQSHTLIPIFPIGTTVAVDGSAVLTGKDYDFIHLPTLTLEGRVLKLTTDLDVTFDSVAAERLNLGPKTGASGGLVRVGTKEPSFNDVRRIVMNLNPNTQKVIAKDASDPQNTLYDTASISFTVDDDPTDNSAYAIYSLAGDFHTNSLSLKNGATDTVSFHLQRCVYDRTTGKLGRPEALDLPYANNFVEVKLVVDNEPTAKRQRLPSQQPLIPARA